MNAKESTMNLGKSTMRMPTMITTTGMINHNSIRIIVIISQIIKTKRNELSSDDESDNNGRSKKPTANVTKAVDFDSHFYSNNAVWEVLMILTLIYSINLTNHIPQIEPAMEVP